MTDVTQHYTQFSSLLLRSSSSTYNSLLLLYGRYIHERERSSHTLKTPATCISSLRWQLILIGPLYLPLRSNWPVANSLIFTGKRTGRLAFFAAFACCFSERQVHHARSEKILCTQPFSHQIGLPRHLAFWILTNLNWHQLEVCLQSYETSRNTCCTLTYIAVVTTSTNQCNQLELEAVVIV